MGKMKRNSDKTGYMPQAVEIGTLDEDENDQDINTNRSTSKYQDVMPIADHLKKYNELQEQNYQTIFYYLGIFCALIGVAFIAFGVFVVFLYPTPPNFVFIGDGITDSDRYREKVPNDLGKYRAQEFYKKQLGSGYVLEIYQKLHIKHRSQNIQFYNRGNKGDNISQIVQNFKQIKSLKPKVLTLMIGSEDCLNYVKYLEQQQLEQDQDQNLDQNQNEQEDININQIIINKNIESQQNPEENQNQNDQNDNNNKNRNLVSKTRNQKINDQKKQQEKEQQEKKQIKENEINTLKEIIDPQTFHSSLQYLLNKFEKEMPNTHFVILEPFAFKGKIDKEHPLFFEYFQKYQMSVKNIGRKGKNFTMVPLQSLIDNRLDQINNLTEFMTSDGLYPSFYLQDLIAELWVKSTQDYVEKLL